MKKRWTKKNYEETRHVQVTQKTTIGRIINQIRQTVTTLNTVNYKNDNRQYLEKVRGSPIYPC